MNNILKILLLPFILASCTTMSDRINIDDFPRHHSQVKEVIHHLDIKPLAVRERMSWPSNRPVLPIKTTEKLYTFAARDMPVDKALDLFARAYNLNILIDKNIQGTINVTFHDLPFNQAMSSILDSLGYYWQRNNNLIEVKALQTKLFNINYINLIRTGSGTSEAQVSTGGGSDGSGSSGGSSDSSSSTSGGNITVEQKNNIAFWSDLEKQLKILVSPKGRLVINRISGTIQVTDLHPRVMEIARYINDINSAILRQVDIQVKIVEVLLNDNFSLGVDWSRLVNQTSGANLNFNINNTITSPTAGVGAALSNVLHLTAADIGSHGENKITAMITALRQQGQVQIVSQPHIRTLNNQSALIKVGTDRTFFRREQNTDNTTAGSNTTTTDVPQVVTEGIVLSITPQISKDGWVMMDISPVVTRVSSVTEVKDSKGDVKSSAPNLDIRQISSLVRAFNGETVVIGGLIQTVDADTHRGVPGLSDVPVAGNLFKAKSTSKARKELIIFLTPTIIDTRKIFHS